MSDSLSDQSSNSSGSEDSDDDECNSSDESEECNPVPKPIKEIDEFTDIAFHPSLSNSMLATNISGYVKLLMLFSKDLYAIYKCESDENCIEKFKVRISSKPIRCAAFSTDGEEIFVMTKDRILQKICATTGKTKRKMVSVHDSSPYCLTVIDKNLLATGDEDGILKLWDLRRGRGTVMEEQAFTDYISSIAVGEKHRFLFAVSGDGTMDTFNIRRKNLVIKSKREKTELLSAQVLKCNTKLLVGSSSGYCLLYNWEEFHLASDRFPGHKGTVECIAKISEDIVCTGSSDGKIRALRILPNRFLGVLGKHHGFPIENVRASADGNWLASTSHDSTIRFWATDFLHDVDINLKKKADGSRRYRRITREGLVNPRADFVADIEKEMDVPLCDIDSDDVTTSEDDENEEAK